MFPSKDRLTICFAHVAYQMRERFLLRQIGVNSFNVRAADEFERRIGEADVVVVSGLWRNELLEKAHRLRFIQSIGAGTDQFDREQLKSCQTIANLLKLQEWAAQKHRLVCSVSMHNGGQSSGDHAAHCLGLRPSR